MLDTTWKSVAELISWVGRSSNIGPRIRALREARKDARGNPDPWTQEQLAQAMSNLNEPPGPFRKMDKQTIWKIENPDKPSANRSVTVDELIGFARVLNVTVADLLLAGEPLAQLEVFTEAIAAAEKLQAVRVAWQEYDRAVRTVRSRLASLGDDVSAELTAETQRVRAKHYESFERLRQRHRPDQPLAVFAPTQPPTPLLAALEDITGPLEPNLWGWAAGRHELVDDIGFTYSGGA